MSRKPSAKITNVHDHSVIINYQHISNYLIMPERKDEMMYN